MSYTHPTAEGFGTLLSKLLGRTVTSKNSFDYVEKGATGTFQTDGGKETAWIAFDLPLAGAAGAALALLPPKMGQTGSRGKKLEDLLHEAYFEVINIIGQMFNQEGVEHVVLKGISYGEVPDPLQANDIVVFDINIDGFGKGTVAIAKH